MDPQKLNANTLNSAKMRYPNSHLMCQVSHENNDPKLSQIDGHLWDPLNLDDRSWNLGDTHLVCQVSRKKNDKKLSQTDDHPWDPLILDDVKV